MELKWEKYTLNKLCSLRGFQFRIVVWFVTAKILFTIDWKAWFHRFKGFVVINFNILLI